MKERISNQKLAFPLCDTYVENKPARKLEFPETYAYAYGCSEHGKTMRENQKLHFTLSGGWQVVVM